MTRFTEACLNPRQFEMAMMQATGQLQCDEAQLDLARRALVQAQADQQTTAVALIQGGWQAR